MVKLISTNYGAGHGSTLTVFGYGGGSITPDSDYFTFGNNYLVFFGGNTAGGGDNWYAGTMADEVAAVGNINSVYADTEIPNAVGVAAIPIQVDDYGSPYDYGFAESDIAIFDNPDFTPSSAAPLFPAGTTFVFWESGGGTPVNPLGNFPQPFVALAQL